VKKDVKSKVTAKNGCDGRLTVKILITTIQVNFVPNCNETWKGNTNSAEFSVIKIFAISLPSEPFLAATLDFTSFSQWPLRAAHFFTAGLFLD